MRKFLDHTRPPRETFDRFPIWVQPLITLLSGKPLVGQDPWFSVSPIAKILIDLTKFSAGIALGTVLIYLGGVWLLALPLAWILVVNGAVSLKLDSHYAAHFCITGNNRLDTWIGEVLTAFVLSSNMDEYSDGHTIEHHGVGGIGTIDDPDLGLLFLMGFETGRDVKWYWKRLLLTLVSPRYHFLFAWERLRSNFITAPMMRRLLAVTIHGTLLALVAWFGGWSVWALAWLLPVGLLVQISIALQVPAEHLWLTRRAPNEAPRTFLRRISHGRFFLVPAPRRDLNPIESACAWAYWAAAALKPMLERCFVCVSVMPAHDYHHRHARNIKWPMENYLRQHEIDQGVSDYRDIYGLSHELIELFVVWSQLPRDYAPLRPTVLRALELATTKTLRVFRQNPSGY
jgi:Fatty acid desaturase